MGESSLEQQIVEQIRQLDAQHQQQVLEYVLRLRAQYTLLAWLERARAFREQLQLKRSFDVQTLLDEVRQERLDDLLGSR